MGKRVVHNTNMFITELFNICKLFANCINVYTPSINSKIIYRELYSFLNGFFVYVCLFEVLRIDRVHGYVHPKQALFTELSPASVVWF